jgi:hypothetical protein
MKKIKTQAKSKDDGEYRADAWERFEQAVDVALHTSAPHKPKAKSRNRARKAKR